MRWLLYTGIALAALIAIVVLAGMALPRSHVVSRHAQYKAPPQTIYALIAGPQDWRPDVAKVEEVLNPGGPRQWKEYSKYGNSVTFEQTGADPPRRYQTRIADKHLPFGGTWTWDIAPAQGGSDVRITEAGEVYNPVFRFIGRFIIGYDKSITDYLNGLGKKLGEAVKIQS